MVDEFQDTDQLQVNMIKRMAGKNFERLCTVGDAQQSIYRFRGADVSVYDRHLASVASTNEAGLIELADNFRSHGDVLAFVDCVFSQPSVFGRSFMSLSASRDSGRIDCPYRGSDPRIEVQLTTYPRGVASDAARATVAQRIAERFAKLVDEGHSAGDMVVLLGSMRVPIFMLMLYVRRGFPAWSQGGPYSAARRKCALRCGSPRSLRTPRILKPFSRCSRAKSSHSPQTISSTFRQALTSCAHPPPPFARFRCVGVRRC